MKASRGSFIFDLTLPHSGGSALGLPEKIQAIEEEMKRTQIHKHTEHHVGLLKAKLSKLKAEQDRAQSSKQGGLALS